MARRKNYCAITHILLPLENGKSHPGLYARLVIEHFRTVHNSPIPRPDKSIGHSRPVKS